MSSRLNLSSPWEEVKEKLKEHNLELTDEDLEYQEGNEELLLDRLAAKLNKSRNDVKILVESISANKGMAG